MSITEVERRLSTYTGESYEKERRGEAEYQVSKIGRFQQLLGKSEAKSCPSR
jgi:hypothetical protein